MYKLADTDLKEHILIEIDMGKQKNTKRKIEERSKRNKVYFFLCRSCSFSGICAGEKKPVRCSNCKSSSIYNIREFPQDFVQNRPEFLEICLSEKYQKLPPKSRVPKKVKIEISFHKPIFYISAKGIRNRMCVAEKNKKTGL